MVDFERLIVVGVVFLTKYKKGVALGSALDGFLLLLDFVDAPVPDKRSKSSLVHALEIYGNSKSDAVKRELEKIIEKLLQRGTEPCEKIVQQKIASSSSKELRSLFEQYSVGCAMRTCAQECGVLAIALHDVK